MPNALCYAFAFLPLLTSHIPLGMWLVWLWQYCFSDITHAWLGSLQKHSFCHACSIPRSVRIFLGCGHSPSVSCCPFDYFDYPLSSVGFLASKWMGWVLMAPMIKATPFVLNICTQFTILTSFSARLLGHIYPNAIVKPLIYIVNNWYSGRMVWLISLFCISLCTMIATPMFSPAFLYVFLTYRFVHASL